MLIPKLFNDYKPLVEGLKKNAERYPWISKLYIPIIEAHSKKYKSFSDFDDWLLVPYFQYLWGTSDSNSKLSEWRQERLEQIEKQLEKIHNSVSDTEFEKLKQKLLDDSVMHPTVNGVHNKLLDFYGELKGMEFFIDKGYDIELIPVEEGKKTPDFIAKKDSAVIVVECKFIHPSNPIRTFIKRYDCYLRCLLKMGIVHGIRTWDKVSYIVQPKDLRESEIKDLKKFVGQIVEKQPNSNEIQLDLNVRIAYKRREIPELNLVTIDDQVAFFEAMLEIFFNEYVSRRAKQAIPQLKSYPKVTKKECVYIFIELDEEFLLPYGGMDCKRKRMEEDFKKKIEEDLKKNHALDVSVVLEVFPKADCKSFCDSEF